MTTNLKNFINGNWITSSGKTERTRNNPANTDEVLYTYKEATWEEASIAIQSAHEAFKSWKKVTPPERGKYLFKIARLLEENKEKLAKLIVKEEGKTLQDAMGEVAYAAGIVQFYAGACRRLKGTIQEADMPNVLIETKPEPLGVVLVVTPWNFPLSIPAWKIAPALASGNTVVLKSSSETPLTAMKFMEIIEQAELPKGVVNHVLAPGSLVSRMIQHKAIKAVTFTGSNAVGKQIYAEAAKDMKRCLLEMGGKNPLIVMEDADLDEAAQLAANGAFGQTGQACTATGRVIVHRKVAEEFLAKLVEKTEQIVVGDGMNPRVNMGPHVNEAERQSTLELIESAKEEGATIITGGGIPEGVEFEKGYYVQPTIITNVQSSMRIAQEEVFGPVNCIIEVDDIDEAIKVANDVDYGLSAAICTKNIDYMNKALNEVEAGIIKVNMTTTGSFYQAPFGGFKQSSTGTYKELGSEALEFYCRYKTRYIKSK